MLSRRAALGGLAAVGAAGGIAPRRPDQWVPAGWPGGSGTPDGVIPLASPGLVQAGAIINTAPNTAQFSALFPISQPGTEVRFRLANHSSPSAQSFVKLFVVFSDPATGTQMETMAAVVVAGAAGTPHVLGGHAVTSGGQVQIQVLNGSASGDAVDLTYWIWQNSRPYNRNILSSALLTAPGFTIPPSALDQTVVMSYSQAPIASGASWEVLMPLYPGMVGLLGNTSSGAADAEFQIAGVTMGFGLLDYSVIFDQRTNANGWLNASLPLPRFQCTLQATNHNAAPQTLSAAMVMQEQET